MTLIFFTRPEALVMSAYVVFLRARSAVVRLGRRRYRRAAVAALVAHHHRRRFTDDFFFERPTVVPHVVVGWRRPQRRRLQMCAEVLLARQRHRWTVVPLSLVERGWVDVRFDEVWLRRLLLVVFGEHSWSWREKLSVRVKLWSVEAWQHGLDRTRLWVRLCRRKLCGLFAEVLRRAAMSRAAAELGPIEVLAVLDRVAEVHAVEHFALGRRRHWRRDRLRPHRRSPGPRRHVVEHARHWWRRNSRLLATPVGLVVQVHVEMLEERVVAQVVNLARRGPRPRAEVVRRLLELVAAAVRRFRVELVWLWLVVRLWLMVRPQ